MKKIIFLCIIFFLAHGCVEANIFTEQKIWSITLRYVTYPVNSDIYKLHVVTSENATNIDALAVSKNAFTWINGVFFCPSDYRECWGRSYTINERFLQWEDKSFYNDTWARWVFWWDTSWLPFIYKTWDLNPEKRSYIYEWLWNFPILFFEGRNMLEYYHDAWLYDRKMSVSQARHYICSNKDGSEIYFWSSSITSLDWLAPALFEIGCYNALNLDAWASTQFLYNGRRIASGSRNVLDWFVISHSEINIWRIEEEIMQLVTLLESRIRRWWNTQKSNQIRDRIVQALVEARNQIYDRSSVGIYSESWVYLWYRLEVLEKNELERVYRINKLERGLRAMKF